MEKKMFHESVDQIEVPGDDVLKAIQTGVRQGHQLKVKQKSRLKVIGVSVAAAAALFMSSGFILPSVGSVMAEIPFLAKLYEHDKVAGNLASQQLITELNEKASFEGIDVRITDAYYDGAMVGVSFDVKGEVKGAKDEIYAFYEIFDRDPNIEETMELVKLLPAEGGYKGHIQLSYPRAVLPAETTLPFNIIGIGETDDSWKDEQGKWNFDVPIKQLPFEKIVLNQKFGTEQNSIQLNSLIKGQSSAAIEYTLSYKDGERDFVEFNIVDNKGEPIERGGSSDSKIEKKTNDGLVTERRRLTLPSRLDTSIITIQPHLRLSDKVSFLALNQSMPAIINSDRQELGVMVQNLEVRANTVIIDFRVNKGDRYENEFMLFKDFAKNDIILVEESRKDIFEQPIKHSVEVLDKEKMLFRSIFDISEIKNFSAEDYVFRINLSSLSTNLPIKLDPINININ
jgi:hypothetical protein